MLTLVWWGVSTAATTDPSDINVWQIVANNGAAVVILALFLFTTRVRTGNDYDGMQALYEKRISDKEDVISAQADIIRGFQQASAISQVAMAKSADVMEALPDKESAVLDEVRGLLARLEKVNGGKAKP